MWCGRLECARWQGVECLHGQHCVTVCDDFSQAAGMREQAAHVRVSELRAAGTVGERRGERTHSQSERAESAARHFFLWVWLWARS